MRWGSDGLTRKDPKRVIQSLDRVFSTIISHHKKILDSSGGIAKIWFRTRTGTKCPCWVQNEVGEGQPNKRCNICYGTGYLEAYQRYGYNTLTYATTANIELSDIQILRSSKHNYEYWILEPNKLTGYATTTDWIDLSGAVEYTYFKTEESINSNNSVTYEYTNDEITWLEIPDDISDMILYDQIKIRAKLSRNSLSNKTPGVRKFILRFRTLENYDDNIDHFNDTHHSYDNFNEPAILVSKRPPQEKIKQTGYGLVLNQDTRFWTITWDDNVILQNDDLIMFDTINPEFNNKIYDIIDIKHSTHYHDMKILSQDFGIKLVQDENDNKGIVYNLD